MKKEQFEKASSLNYEIEEAKSLLIQLENPGYINKVTGIKLFHSIQTIKIVNTIPEICSILKDKIKQLEEEFKKL